MFDNFHSQGTTPVESDRLKILVRELAIEDAVLQSMWLEMPSGPDAVLTLMVMRRWWTSAMNA